MPACVLNLTDYGVNMVNETKEDDFSVHDQKKTFTVLFIVVDYLLIHYSDMDWFE
jgi:hypothetical protein